jgi:hypothetical protein
MPFWKPKPDRRFGEIFESLSRSLAALPEAPELAEELRRLGEEIHGLAQDHPLVGGIQVALRMTDGAQSAAAPLISLAAEIIADHAPRSGWSREDLLDYLEGLGPARTADFLEELAAAVGPR